MKGNAIDDCIHLWPVFSVQMVAGVAGGDEADARARLDRLVARGVLARWEQWGPGLPDVYYLAPRTQ